MPSPLNICGLKYLKFKMKSTEKTKNKNQPRLNQLELKN